MINATILVVEDNSIVMLELKDRLEDMGYKVVDSASSGLEAVKKAEELHPNLIIMDIRLKGEMDGIDAAAKIKRDLDIPFIYLTAHTDNDTLQRAKITEPYGYIIKPFEERELHSAVEMALYKYEMEKKLKESQHWLSTTLRSIGDALIATDSDGTIKIFNHVAESITGWKFKEAFGIDINKIFKIKDKENPVLISLKYHSILGAANKILIGKNGKETPVDFSSAPIKDEKGSIAGIVLVFRDITERIRTKEIIEKQQIFLRQIIDTDPNYISVKNAEGKFELTNRAIAEALGTTTEEIIGRYDSDFFDAAVLTDQRKTDASVINSLEEIFIPEEKLIDSEGKVHLLQTFKRAVDSQDGNEKLVLSVGSDITELKRTENALRESEDKIRTLLKAIPDIVIRYRRNGTILDVHSQGTDFFLKDNVVGEKIYNVIEKELAEKILLFSELAIKTNEVQVFEHDLLINDFNNSKELRILNLTGENGGETVISNNSRHEFVIIVKDITQKKLAHLETMKYLAEIEKSRDMLGQKAAELSFLNKKLNESEQELKELNTSKDKFFSIIAHDLRSPFTSLLGLSELLSSEYKNMSVPELHDISFKLLKSAKLTFSLLENLLQWGRIRTGRIKFNPEIFSLSMVVNQMIDLYRSNAVAKRILLTAEVDPGISVYADLNMVETILRNLISNSIKFTNELGNILISAELENEMVKVMVKDNGVGIKPEAVEKLFQIDQNISTLGTLNEAGSGLGLILCKEFIEMNNGIISVTSEPGAGSIFYFTLPVSRDNKIRNDN